MTEYALPPTPADVDEFAWRAAISAIRDHCNWHIAPVVTETITVDGPGAGMLLLPTLHLTDLVEVLDDGVAVDPEILQWSVRGAVRKGRGPYWFQRWTSKYRGVTLTMTHGYEDFPQGVIAVARDMAKSVDRVGASALGSGPHTVQFGVTAAGVQAGAVGISDLQLRVLHRYTVPGRP